MPLRRELHGDWHAIACPTGELLCRSATVPTARHGRGAGEASVRAGSLGVDQPSLVLRLRGRKVGEGVDQTAVESVASEAVKIVGEPSSGSGGRIGAPGGDTENRATTILA